MSNYNWTEKQVKWFLNRFRNEKRDIKNSFFSRIYIEGVGRYSIKKEDNHRLMELVVRGGFAIATVGNADSDDYTIRLLPRTPIAINKAHFSASVLRDPRIDNLPQIAYLNPKLKVRTKLPPSEELLISFLPFREQLSVLLPLKMGVWTCPAIEAEQEWLNPLRLTNWLDLKLEWLEIVNLLRVFQVCGKVDKKNLKGDWTKNMKQYLLLRAEAKAALYKALRTGWKTADLSFEGQYQDADELFLGMLFADATEDYRQRCIEPDELTVGEKYRAHRKVKGFSEMGDYGLLFNKKTAMSSASKLIGDYLSRDIYGAASFASGTFLSGLVQMSGDDEFKAAHTEYKKVLKKLRELDISDLNRERNLKKISPET